MRTPERIVAALRDAPMDDDALMHELDINRRSLAQGLGVLRRRGVVEQRERGMWHLLQDCETPTPLDSPLDPSVVSRRARRGEIAHQVVVPHTPPAALGVPHGDHVLQVLIAAGRITAADLELASQLIRGRA